MKFIHYCILTLLLIMLAGCESTPAPISLGDNQDENVQLPYDCLESAIEFEAEGDWIATVAPTQRSSETDWLHLDQTSGSAGSVHLTFSMDNNYTGERRSACIIITCNDESISITVTQYPEGENPENDDSEGDEDNNQEDNSFSPDEPTTQVQQMLLTCDSYYFVDGIAELESQESVRIEYLQSNSGKIYPTGMFVETYDAIDETIYATNWTIDYQGNSISARALTENGSKHIATLENDRVVSGSYSFDGGTTSAKYSIEYDQDGRISKSTPDGSTPYSFEWVDSNLTAITNAQNGDASFTYSEHHNPRPYNFNLNWLFSPDEYLAFSTGDPSRIWAMLGYLGSPSEYLISSYITPDGLHTNIEYTHISDNHIECVVVEWLNGTAITRTEWTIRI